MNYPWKKPPFELSLSNKEIHIWRAKLDLSENFIQKLRETLSIDEKLRAKQFRFDKDRNHFITARGILRNILGKYLNVEPSRFEFRYGNNGKPALSKTFGNGIIHFNLSHSEGLAIYVFTRDQEIGVDLENIGKLENIEKIVESFFSRREKADFCTLPQSSKNAAFINYWTIKEAYLKAIGTGLSYSMNKFDVSIVPGKPARLLKIDGDSKKASQWSIYMLKPATGYVAAIALWNKGSRIKTLQYLCYTEHAF